MVDGSSPRCLTGGLRGWPPAGTDSCQSSCAGLTWLDPRSHPLRRSKPSKADGLPRQGAAMTAVNWCPGMAAMSILPATNAPEARNRVPSRDVFSPCATHQEESDMSDPRYGDQRDWEYKQWENRWGGESGGRWAF